MLRARVTCFQGHSPRSWGDDDRRGYSTSEPPDASLDSTRRRIYDYVVSHPGTHVREVCRELGLGMGDVQYHIHRLEKEGRINSIRRGLYKFLYPSILFGSRQRDVLGVLSLETPRDVLLSLIEKPGMSQVEIARALNISQSTAHWHMKRLVQLGIVERLEVGRTVTYSVVSDLQAEIANFVKSYHTTTWERWSSRLADIFIAYALDTGEVEREGDNR